MNSREILIILSRHGYTGRETQDKCGYVGICLCWAGNKRKGPKISIRWMGNKWHKESQENSRRKFQGHGGNLCTN